MKNSSEDENEYIPIVEAIMEESRPKTQEKGKDMESAREPIEETCSIKFAGWNHVTS